jgi:hypothetical protein
MKKIMAVLVAKHSTSFVWTEEQTERLFDSIMREYPISTLLVWRTKAKVKCRKFIDHYKQSLKLSDFTFQRTSGLNY